MQCKNVNHQPSAIARAIEDNDVNKVEQLIKENQLLDPKEFWIAFSKPETISPEILKLLEKHHAFPKEITMTTLKYHLYIRGNRNISPADFVNNPDLNLVEC